MAKSQTIFICQSCGAQSPRWQGKCTQCDSWNSLQETATSPVSISSKKTTSAPVISLADITEENYERISTHIKECDRVLGGGIVPGMVILIGGDPGIGKSTLALHIARSVGNKQKKVLYATGEESLSQIYHRAQRIHALSSDIHLIAETDVDALMHVVDSHKPDLLIIDSIQTLKWQLIGSAAGSVSQVRECASVLTQYAKKNALPVIMIGHITKDGAIAGPKVLEHIVDTVLYFEGERNGEFRILRSIKNRFGAANEIGIFEMTGDGLVEVDNPSRIFLDEKTLSLSGSCVVATVEGSRPLLVEIQALVSPCTFGIPRRTATGVDQNRLAIIIAVLEKIAGLHLSAQDVFINVTGGLFIEEPAADLGIALAIASSFRNKPMQQNIVVFGEIGLNGEIRSVSHAQTRLDEIEKLGFKNAASYFKNDIATTLHTINIKTIVGALELLGDTSTI